MKRCTCGYTVFRERTTRTVTAVQRWMFFDSPGGGLGSTPFGTLLGGGTDGLWGLFDATQRSCVSEVSCESCQRVRLRRVLGGFTYLGSYIDAGSIYVVGADDEGLGTLSIRLVGPETYTVALSNSAEPVLPVIAVPPDETAEDEPTSSVADVLLRGIIPDVVPGTYVATLIDSCSGAETPLGTIDLEASVMILYPRDADLGGASRLWLQGFRLTEATAQPASGTPSTVPFDKVDVLYEFDAELGTTPTAQGLSLLSGSDASHQYVSGGAYQVTGAVVFNVGAGSGDLSPDTMHVYSRYLDTGGTGVAGSGGYNIGCGGANATEGFGCGIGVTENAVWAIFSSGAVQVSDELVPGWLDFGASGDVTGLAAVWVGDTVTRGDFPLSGAGTGLGGGFATLSGTTSGAVKHFVVCGPGRFIRAKWLAVTPVAAPVLRLYFVADSASGTRTARFRVCYGPASAGPYTRPASTTDFTVNLNTANVVVEASATLSGLTANTGFYFTVERVWDHADDLLTGTAHLLYATVRSV